LFEIEVAENGLQALQLVTSCDIDYFDIVLMDLNMPIMDGFEACKRIHAYLTDHENLVEDGCLPRRLFSMTNNFFHQDLNHQENLSNRSETHRKS